MTEMKVWSLAKIPIMSFWGINKALHSNDTKEKRKIFGVAIILVIALISVCSSFFASAVAYTQVGLGERIPAVSFASACGICFVIAILRTHGFLFAFKDYDTVMSLPVSTAQVVMSRLLVLYVTCQLFCLPIQLTGNIVYITSAAPGALYYLTLVITLLITPLLPIAAAALVGVVIAFIASRMKHKNVVTSILLIAFTLGIMWFSFSGPSSLERAVEGMSDEEVKAATTALLSGASDNIEAVFAPAHWLTLAVKGNPFALLGVVTLFLLAAAAVIALITVFYKDINTRLEAHVKRKNFVLGKISKSSPFMALYIKDLKRFFSSSIFLLNMGMGAILLIAAAVALLVIPLDTINEQLQTGVETEAILPLLRGIAPFAISLFVSMCIIAAPLVSLEGKNVWILKSIPVKYETIYLAKIAVQLTVTIPSAAISGILLLFVIPFNATEIIFLFVTPAVMSVMLAELSVLFGIRFANYEWTNEVTVIKQSMSSMICMLLSFVIIGAAIPLYLNFGSQPFTAIYTLVALIAALILHSINRKSKLK